MVFSQSSVSAQCTAPAVVSTVNYCVGSTASPLSATGTNLNWTNGLIGSVGGTDYINSVYAYTASDVNNNQKTFFTVNTVNTQLTGVDYYITYNQSTVGLVLGIFNHAGTLVATSSTSSTQGYSATLIKVKNTFNYTFTATGNYSIGIVSGYGNIGYYTPSFPVTEATGTITLTGTTYGKCCFNNIQFRAPTTSTPTPSTTVAGTTVYYVTQTNGACTSAPATITVNVNSNSQAPYTTNQLLYYTLDGSAIDANGNNHGTLQNGPVSSADRFGIANKAYTLNGSSQYISTANYCVSQSDFTESIWFKTTTTSGGTLIGYSNTQVGNSTTTDRHLYMDNAGKVHFSMGYNHGNNPVSSLAYNDGNWHSAMATFSPSAGIKLYMDGALVGSDASVNQTIYITGYWKIGFENLSGGWPSQPSSNYFAGSVDEVLIYDKVLTPSEIQGYYNAPYGAGNNSPAAIGATVTLTASTVSGASYTWSGPDNFTSVQQNPSFTFTAPKQGIYSLQINGSGCLAYTEVVPVVKTGRWAGAYSTDWTNTQNWEDNTVPVAATDVVIPAGRTYYPVVITTQAMKGLSVLSGGALTLSSNGKFNIGGTISNAGKFDVSAGTIELNGSSAQTIPANAFSNNTIKNLIISNNVTLAGEDTLTGTLSFGSSSKAFATGDFLTMKSDVNATARINDITNGGVNSGNTITGKVNIERYVPARRAWRLLSAPVSATNAPTINAAWQEGVTNASSNPNPVAGHGLFITGGTVANGFDQASTSNPSVKVYSGGAFNALSAAGTNQPISNYPGYFLFTWGDRSINMALGKAAPPTPTVLRIKGEVKTNDQAVTVAASGYTVLGNPYVSAIDFGSLTKSNVKNSFYVWDPYLAGSNGVGGYVTFLYNSSTGSYDKTSSASTLSQYIPSGTAVLVQSLNGTASGTVTVKETSKSAGAAGQVYNFVGGVQPQVRVNFNIVNDDGTASLLDGVLTTYSDEDVNDVNDNDALKINGSNESMGISRSGNMLAIERRKTITATDTTFLNIFQLRLQPYRLEIVAEGMSASGMTAVLKDNYAAANNNTYINLNGTTTVNFTVTSDPASYAADRFSIIYRPAVVVPVTFRTVKAYRVQENVAVEWSTENEINIDHYEVERSADGTAFSKINTTAAASLYGGSANYHITDNAPFAGMNYYRIKSVSPAGAALYSNIVKVNMKDNGTVTPLTVYPNPVTGSSIGVQLNLAKGQYMLQLFNTAGQLVTAKQITHTGGSSNISVDIDSNLPAGKYELRLTGNDTKITTSVLKK